MLEHTNKRCTCGKSFSSLKAAWLYKGTFYCSEGCARFHRESIANINDAEEPKLGWGV